MTITDLKIYGLNGAVFAMNFSSVEIGLKILLTVTVIGYTMQKWYLMNRDKNKDEKNK